MRGNVLQIAPNHAKLRENVPNACDNACGNALKLW